MAWRERFGYDLAPTMVAWLFSLAVLGTASLAPPAAEPLDVALDWSAVSDATVARCGLGQLQTQLLQTLLEEGFAVVDEVRPNTMALSLAEEGGVFVLTGVWREHRGERRVALPKRCDSTVAVDLQASLRSLTRELAAHARAAERLAPAQVTAEAPRPAGGELSRPLVRLALGVAGSRPSSPFAFAGVELRGRFAGFVASALADASYRASRAVTVLEPAAGAAVSRQWAWGELALEAGLAAQLLVHRYVREDSSGGHLDLRVGIPLRLELGSGAAGLVLVPTYRLRSVDHRWQGAWAYRADHVGLLVALTVGLGEGATW